TSNSRASPESVISPRRTRSICSFLKAVVNSRRPSAPLRNSPILLLLEEVQHNLSQVSTPIGGRRNEAKDSVSADPDPLPPQHGPDLPVPLREERALLEHCSDLLQELSIGVSGLRASLLEHAPLLRRPATTHRRRGIDTRAGRAKDRADHGERVAPIRRRAHHPSDLLSFL